MALHLDSAREHQLATLSSRLRPALIAFFQRRVGSRDEAEDLTQEVLARVAKQDPQSLRNADAYVFQMASNLLRDRARRAKSRALLIESLSQDPDDGVERLDPGAIHEAREQLGAIIRVLEGLPERSRNIFILYRLEGVGKAQIAHAYGMSISGVDKHLMKVAASIARFRSLRS